METFATKLTHLFLKNHYIEPDQAEWFQYGLVRRMMGCLTFFLLLPVALFLLAGSAHSFICILFVSCECGQVVTIQKRRTAACLHHFAQCLLH